MTFFHEPHPTIGVMSVTMVLFSYKTTLRVKFRETHPNEVLSVHHKGTLWSQNVLETEAKKNGGS
jgi:hypothetical protein